MSKTQPTRQKTRVMVVDDHPLIRQGIRMLISQEADMEVCGEADSATAALELLDSAAPQVAVVDLSLKESSGLDLIKDIRIRRPDVLVLVLSMREEGLYAERSLRAGARGYITKEEGPSKVLEGIRTILRGQIFVSEMIASKVMSRLVNRSTSQVQPIDTLTDRELQVFEMVGQGRATREIAKALHVSAKTIDSHREHIKQKLQIVTASDLLKHAIEWVQSHRAS